MASYTANMYYMAHPQEKTHKTPLTGYCGPSDVYRCDSKCTIKSKRHVTSDERRLCRKSRATP